jgi:polyphosphate kinase
MIQALYRAAIAGVNIDLIVRGMCSLRPGIPGVSDNIRVVSIIGRFLEHDRVMYFENAGEHEVYISSADWMERNLYRRVELCTPIEAEDLKQRIINELQYYLLDNTQAWVMNSDGSYSIRSPENNQEAFIAQQKFLEDLADSS